MGARRFGPLILLLLLGTVVIGARLFQVQVIEHDVWASEAKNLVRRGALVPYQRGKFLDAQGRALVRNEPSYKIEFSYRDFRRGHPLGQVAHAWSSLTLAPVPLDQVWADLEGLASDLVQLTRQQLDDFVAGEEPLQLGIVAVPANVARVEKYRGSRRSDVRYYMARLLQLDSRQALEAARDGQLVSLIDFAVEERGFEDRDALLLDLEQRLGRARDDLLELAEELDRHERGRSGATDPHDGRSPTERLIAQLEGWRVKVEDETASVLFREATQFSVGRVESDQLLAYLDLYWLEELLRWDPARTARWAAAERASHVARFHGWYLPMLWVELELAPTESSRAAVVAASWRTSYTETSRGASEDHLVVFDQLDSLFDLRIPRSKRLGTRTILPVGLGGLGGGSDLEQLARLELWLPGEPEPTAEALERAAEQWREHLAGVPDRVWIEARSVAVLSNWEGRFQAALIDQLALLNELEPEHSLALARWRLKRAGERTRSVLKDRGSRPQEVVRRPAYDLVHLLTRYPDQFAGFAVRDSTERLTLKDERDVPVALGLVGTVLTQELIDVVGQREQRRELAELLHQGERSEEQRRRLGELLREVARPDEYKGGDGLEGYFERELTGHNGYRERRGMQELVDGDRPGDLVDLDPIDGQDIRLTLDLDLQRAALDALMRPGEDPNPIKRDRAWLDRPTGAIVICRPNGDVLAAASFPDVDRGPRVPGEKLGPADLGLERTLRMPSFQPPGSVFKPFVAAWALEHVQLDVRQTMVCGPIAKGGYGFEDLGCHAQYGHRELALREALKRSCNAYFAWLGTRLTQRDFQGLALEFGFGQPTGVHPDPERGGLYEEYNPRLFERPFLPRDFKTAGNGLAVVQVSPMQLARGYCALATGVLPDMRLVDRIGGVELARKSRPLAISAAHLAVIRRGLHDVTHESGGSAMLALGPQQLGFSISGKTGSADLGTQAVLALDGRRRVRKHTWFAGWFPPEDPVAVVVVFVSNTLQTSSHTSVWVANKLLRSPEVAGFIEREVPR